MSFRIGVFGPHLGANEGQVISQGEVLRSLLLADGHDVIDASRRPRRVPRAIDTVSTVGRTGHSLEAAVVEVFSGPGFAMAELTFLALRALRVPTVAWLHGGNLPAFSARHPQRVRSLLASAAAVVAPSPFLAKALHAFRTDIAVIPNVLPLDLYPTSTRSPARPRLLWMRAFHPIYRPILAVEVLAALKQDCPEATLTMAGQDNGLVEDTKRRALEVGVSEAVRFPGFFGPNAKYEALECHDVFLSTNAIDNAPVSVLEAAASGLIVVAMETGGIADLLSQGESAEFVADGAVDVMASVIASILADEDRAAKLSTGAQRNSSILLSRNAAHEWKEILRTVVRRR